GDDAHRPISEAIRGADQSLPAGYRGIPWRRPRSGLDRGARPDRCRGVEVILLNILHETGHNQGRPGGPAIGLPRPVGARPGDRVGAADDRRTVERCQGDERAAIVMGATESDRAYLRASDYYQPSDQGTADRGGHPGDGPPD